MKKLSVAMMFFVCPAFVFAQGVGLGIKGGVNFANVAAEDLSTSSITSFHAGAYVNLNLSETFGITPEILWTGHGAEIEDVEFNTDYIAVPIMLRFKPVPVLFLEAGPQFSFLTSAEADGVDIKDQMKNNSFGLALGAGVGLPLGFNGGIRYILGFTNINEVSDDEIKDRTFQIYVGWTLFGGN